MKLSKILWIIISIILLWWVYYLYISPYIFKPTVIEVPNILGLKEDEALNVLKANNIKYNVNYIDGDNEVVSKTMPIIGSRIYEGSTIDIYVNKKMPSYYQSFVGLIYEANVELIDNYCKKHNISYSLRYQSNNEFISGQIIAQSKDTNMIINPNDTIIFTISINDEYFTMPNLVGLHIDEVIDILDNYGLCYNIIYYESPLDSDIIIYQSVNEGVTIKKGNEYPFDIYVSKSLK